MSERRSFFRIDETIALEFKVIDEITANKSQPEALFSNANSLKLYSELKKIDADNTQYLFQIKELSRPLGEYLHNLNRKIELLGQELMADQKPNPPSKTLRQVNLSEGGIAFGSTNSLTAGDYIGLRVVFLPSNAGLILFARIIRCEPSNTGEFQVAAKFHHITDLQQQLIGQQIMRAQMAEKRRLHENS
jgi:PilZ domain